MLSGSESSYLLFKRKRRKDSVGEVNIEDEENEEYKKDDDEKLLLV